MALFVEILTEKHLPEVGTSYEKDCLDFKVRASAHAYELAKDIAAFSNHIGGVILLGAEDERDRLKGYVPLSKDEADSVRRAYLAAVKDRCSPSPRVEIAIVPVGSGFVVAVNAYPLPDQIVGVKVPVQKAPGETIDLRAFLFPVRRHSDTVFLATTMEPRRVPSPSSFPSPRRPGGLPSNFEMSRNIRRSRCHSMPSPASSLCLTGHGAFRCAER